MGRTTKSDWQWTQVSRKMPRNANFPMGRRPNAEPDFEGAESAAIEALHMCEEGFFNSLEETPEKVIELAFPVMETERAIRKHLKDPEAFVANSLRKRRVEVNERRLNPEERELMRTA